MPADLTMPKLSDSEADIVIIRWLKAPGEGFRRGDGLIEVETDKATVVFEAEDDGTLEAILVSEGESAAVGQPIARLAGDEGPAAGEQRPPGRGERPTLTRRPPECDTGRTAGRGGARRVAPRHRGNRPRRPDHDRGRSAGGGDRPGPAGCSGPRGRHAGRPVADAGDDRPPHGAVGCRDPDLHRLRRRRRVGDRRAPQRRARGGATNPLAQRLRGQGCRARAARTPPLQRVVRRGQDRALLARQRRGRRCGGRRAPRPRRHRRRP